MSDTIKHQRAYFERQEECEGMAPDFDGRRYGNKRRAIALLKLKDRRRDKRRGKRELEDSESPLYRKFILD